MYTHLMTLEEIKRVSWGGTSQKERRDLLDRLLEIALNQDSNLEQVLEDNGDLKDKIYELEMKQEEYEETISELEYEIRELS